MWGMYMVGRESKIKTITLSGIRYILGAFLLLLGLSSFSDSFITGLLLLLAGIITIPLTAVLVEEKLNTSMPGKMRFIIVFCLTIFALAAVPSVPQSTSAAVDSNKDVQEMPSSVSGTSVSTISSGPTPVATPVSTNNPAPTKASTQITETTETDQSTSSRTPVSTKQSTPSSIEQTQTTSTKTNQNTDLACENLTVHFLDVGQGDSILVEYDKKAMLIDAGESDQGEVVSDYLQDQGISTLGYVVATHPHSDHIGGMNDILNNFQIKHFIDSGYPHTTQTYEDMITTIDKKNISFETVKAGQTIDFDPAVDIEVLNPSGTYSDDLNENSVVLKLTYGDTSILLMGDAGLDAEEKIMKAGSDIDSDILKVGHHGSDSGSGDKFISTISPEVSVIEVGAENDYGHPNAEILERLQTASKVYRTDLDGTITVTTDGSNYTVAVQKSDTSYVSPNPTSTETSEVIPTETSTSEPAKAQATTSDTTDTSSASNYENSKSTSTTTSSTINANSGSIIANSKTHVYHNAGCRYVEKIKPEHLTYFNSRKEAEAADYRACKVCGG